MNSDKAMPNLYTCCVNFSTKLLFILFISLDVFPVLHNKCKKLGWFFHWRHDEMNDTYVITMYDK